MIVTEFFDTRDDGVQLFHTYSDNDKLIVRNDGAEFSNAIDVEGCGYTYVESTKDIPRPVYGYYGQDEATEADYRAELRRLGVEV